MGQEGQDGDGSHESWVSIVNQWSTLIYTLYAVNMFIICGILCEVYICSETSNAAIIASRYPFKLKGTNIKKRHKYQTKKLSKRSSEYQEVLEEFKRTCSSEQVIEV